MRHKKLVLTFGSKMVATLFLTTGCSREQVPQPAQGLCLATNEVKTIDTEMSAGDAAFCMIANYPVDYKEILREAKFNKLCWRILKETKKEESARLYALLADAAIRQQVSHETLERRGIQIEGLWKSIFSTAFSFGQKGLVLAHDDSFEYWERMIKFFERVKDEIEDMKTILDDGMSQKSRRDRMCVYSMVMHFRSKIIRDARYFLGKDNGYADLLTDEQRCEILRRLLQLEEYAKNVEAEITGMIRVPSAGEAEEKMHKDLQRGRFDSDGVGSGAVF